MKQLLKHYLFELLLIGVVGILFFANRTHGTYLMGWDNLQTDLNPWLGVKRAFFSVWEEYQSFGLVAGNAHAADLIRSLFIWLISFILPQDIIRYFFHMLMVLVGGLGMMKLLEHLGFKNEKKPIAFFGSLFYIFNLGTVQLFFLPYEAFSIFFAALPWELWIFIHILNILKKQKFTAISKKELFIFIVINILATPQNFIQTIFVVYMLLLGIILVITAIERKSFAVIMKGSILFVLILIINSFWILPQGYFLKTSSSVVKEAKTNVMATSETVYQNKEKGTITDFLKMEGFYYDLSDANHQPLFLKWQKHFQQPVFAALPYLLAGIVLTGLFSKRPFHKSFIALYGLMAVALLSATFPFSFINDLLRQNYFINQIFRSPFTKFIVPYSLISAYLFTSGLYLIISYVQRHNLLKKISRKHFYTTIGIILFLYAFPVFEGYFISPAMKVHVPQDYSHVIQYFNKQDPNKRIALLPEYTIWGWFFTKWGFNGSGFLWYGIEQPIVSRTFDVWSNKSESYFWEMKAALESEDVQKFQTVLDKYRIDYLVLDSSLLPVSSTLKGMQYDRTTALLQNNSNIKLVKKEKMLSVYQVTHQAPVKNFIAVASQLPNVGPSVNVTTNDTAYSDIGEYKTDPANPYDAYYPFLDFLSQTRIAHSSWQLSEDATHFYLKRTLDKHFKNITLSTLLPTNYSLEYHSALQYQDPLPISIQNGVLTMTIQKRLIDSVDPKKSTFVDCTGNKGKYNVNKNNQGVTITASDRATVCFSYIEPALEQRFGYLVKIESTNAQGPRLFFYVNDRTKQQTQIEDRLQNNIEYYALPSRFQYGVGYDLVFHNDSYLHTTEENTLKSIQFYRLPYEEIKAIQLIGDTNTLQRVAFSEDFKSTKQTYYRYIAQTGPSIQPTDSVILYQEFHQGWNAYNVDKVNFWNSHLPFLFGTELKDHFSVNNWANGWRVENSTGSNTVIIIFWPQYLEFIGFGLLGLMIAVLLLQKKVRN